MGIIAGALAGAGEAGEKSGLMLQKKFADEDLLKMKVEADKALQASMQEFHRGENVLNRDLTREEGAAGRAVTREEGAAGRTHAKDLQTETHKFTKAENLLGRDLQVKLANLHESAANARHGASMGVQMAQLKATQEQVHLEPQTDGTILKMDRKGNSLGFVSHPVTHEVIKGNKLSDAAKILMTGNEAIIKSLEVAAAKTETSPEERVALNKRIEVYQAENQRLAGMKVDAPAAAKGAQWDNSTGDVMLDGKKIGTAKTEADARKLLANARGGGAAAPAPAAPKPVPRPNGIVAGQVDDAPGRTRMLDSIDEWRERNRMDQIKQSLGQ